MRFSPPNSRARFPRSPSPRSRLLRLRGNLRRVLAAAGGRRYAQRRDLISLPPQDLELEAVEREALARFGDGARLVDDETGNGGGFLVRQVPVEFAVQFADRRGAVDDVGAVRLRPDALAHRDFVLVGDGAENLVENVLAGD